MPFDQRLSPFFDAGSLPDSELSYVLWLDVMGVRSTLIRSLPIAANFVFKLHSAVLDASHRGLSLYPVMDGVFAVATQQDQITDFIADAYQRLASVFVNTAESKHRFLVKACLAFGPVVHGRDVSAQATRTLAAYPAYRDSVLLGIPMVQAFESERFAPPFGVYVHESARAFSPQGTNPIPHAWWRWYQPGADAQDLRNKLNEFFDWCACHSGGILYPPDRIERHREDARQYFIDA